MRYNEKRLARNAESKASAENDGQPWCQDELDWLQTWDRTEAELADLAEILGRTLEACREQFYLRRRQDSWAVVVEGRRAPRSACSECFLVHGLAQGECLT